MNYRKPICLLLALLLTLSMAACTGGIEETVPTGEAAQDPTETSGSGDCLPDENPTEPEVYTPQVYPVDGLGDTVVDNPIIYFTLTMGESYDSIYYLTAYNNDDGTACVEYVGPEKKVGNVDDAALHGLTAALEESGLIGLSGRSEYADGECMASLYVTYADGTVVAADFSGLMPQEFKDGYPVIEEYFGILTENIPLYVPAPQIMGSVNAAALAEMEAILNCSGIQDLDMLIISDVPLDEHFSFTAGLSGSEGITNGTACSAMMMTTPFSLVIVTAEDSGSIESIREDFNASIDWRKWICVAPESALIAQKGNMVLCLMGSGTMYAGTAAAIGSAGWTEVETLKNPDL